MFNYSIQSKKRIYCGLSALLMSALCFVNLTGCKSTSNQGESEILAADQETSRLVQHRIDGTSFIMTEYSVTGSQAEQLFDILHNARSIPSGQGFTKNFASGAGALHTVDNIFCTLEGGVNALCNNTKNVRIDSQSALSLAKFMSQYQSKPEARYLVFRSVEVSVTGPNQGPRRFKARFRVHN